MKAEIKYIVLLYCVNMLLAPIPLMLISWRWEPRVIPPMMVIGFLLATASLMVGMRWMRAESVIFLTKDTVIDGVKMGGGK